MKHSAQQTAYTQAQRAYELADARHGKYERDFLAARSITDRGGRPARHIWQVEDDALFDRLEEEYQADPVATQLQADYTAARVAFIQVEKDLISWALSIVPAVVRDTLAPAAKQDAATRKKIIDLALQLDPSTVAR